MIEAWTRMLAGRWREMGRFWVRLEEGSFQECASTLAVEGEGKRGIGVRRLDQVTEWEAVLFTEIGDTGRGEWVCRHESRAEPDKLAETGRQTTAWYMGATSGARGQWAFLFLLWEAQWPERGRGFETQPTLLGGASHVGG